MSHRSRLSTIVIDCDQFETGVAFWTGALGCGVQWRNESYVGLDADLGGLHLILQRVPEPKTCKSRVHLDFVTDNLEAEVLRLEALGARRQQLVEHWWIMQDPCGNEFCVVDGLQAEDIHEARVWES